MATTMATGEHSHSYRFGEALEIVRSDRELLRQLDRAPQSREVHTDIRRRIRRLNEWLSEACQHWSHDVHAAGIEGSRAAFFCRLCEQRLVRDDSGSLVALGALDTAGASCG